MSKQLTCSVIGLPVRSVCWLAKVLHDGAALVTVTDTAAGLPFSTASLA
jgi:hypothetical protein